MLRSRTWLVATTMFVIEHFHCPGKFCWQHCSRISSLSGPTAIPRHLRICIWPGVEALLLHDPTISHHPVSYLGLGFETQKPRTDSCSLCSTASSLPWGTEDGMPILPTEWATGPVCRDWRDSWDMRLLVWKPGKSQTIQDKLVTSVTKNHKLPRNAEKNTSLYNSQLLQLCS